VVLPGVLVLIVVVVVVVSATASPRSLDAALDDTFLAGGSAEGCRETLRLRVVASGEAKAAFCDRVAGIVMMVVVVLDGCVVVVRVSKGSVEYDGAQWRVGSCNLARARVSIVDVGLLLERT
jgi:hypothetical protein